MWLYRTTIASVYLSILNQLSIVSPLQLKGCPTKDTGAQVGATLKQVRLRHKANAFAHTLSGGAKRRLSLGMALIGNSKVSTQWPT